MSEDAPPRRFRLPFLAGRDRSRQPQDDLRILADFEGANVTGASVVSPSHVRFSAQAHSSPRPLWFYFCLQGSTAPSVRCELRNADQCLGPRLGWRTARPVFSPDGRSWARVARAEYIEEATDFGYFAFTVPVVGRKTYVAYCYPYTTADLQALVQPFSRNRSELCRTAEDRSVPYLKFGNHETPDSSAWIITRQHAGETPGSYAAEGAIRTLAAGEGLPSLETTAYHVVPMLDMDGVFHGRYGKDQEPVDFNRDWRDHPVRPEVNALIRAIRASHERAPVKLALDFHAPHHGDATCYAFVYRAEEGVGGELSRSFLRFLAEESPQTVGFREADLRTDLHPERSAREYLRKSLQVPVVTMEISYHLSQSGQYLTQADYRDLGAAMARACDRALIENP